MLKTGDYDLLSMRMEQYLTHTDYALYEVIINGDSPVPEPPAVSTVVPPKIKTQKLARKNELKAKSTLLLAIPNEHLLKFHSIKDAKSLWEAIKIRNKPDIETLSMNDLYNNLKVYDAEIKGKSSSSSNSHNVAFVSSENTSSINETVNAAHDIPAAGSKEQPSASSYANDVIFSFFASQSNTPQLDNEDLEQIGTDDLEEMDLKWQMAMITMRVRKFIKKIGRNLNFNGKEPVGFDKIRVECYNFHRRGHFARECHAPKNQGNKSGDNKRRIVLVETPASALVVQDGLGGYDWSYQAEEVPTDFALMAHSSDSANSSNFEVQSCSNECLQSFKNLQKQYDQQREILNKDNIEILGYQYGLESLEDRIHVHHKNETVFEESIAFLKYDVQVRDISIKDLKNQLEEAIKEKYDLKEKLNKFEESSKNLSKLINSQMSANDKTGIGDDSQLSKNEMSKCKIFEAASDSSVSEIDEDNNQAKNRYKVGIGYHAVPPPYTENYMPPRADLSFARLDDSVFKFKISETRTSVNENELIASKSIVNAADGKKENVVKSSACWIWRPKGKLVDHTSKDNGSYTLKRFNYVDPNGRLESATAKVKMVNDQEQIQDLVDKNKKKKKPIRKQRNEAEVSNDESEDEDYVPTPSSDPLPSGRRVKPPMEKDSLGAQKDASKQERMIEEIDQNAEIVLDDETQGRTKNDEMFGVDDLAGEEVVMDTITGEHEEQIIKDISTAKPVTTVGEVVTTTTVKDSAAPTTDMSTIIPAAATTVTTAVPTPRATCIIFHEQKQSQIPTVSSSKDKGKAKMIEPEVPIKKKDQIRINAELQAIERKEFSEVQKAKLLVEPTEKRKKHFAALRAQEKRNKPPTKTQMKSQMTTYLKHMGGYKQSHRKVRSFDEIKKLFDRDMRKVNDFIAMDSEAQKSSTKEAQESSTKRTVKHLESDISKKQKVDENVKLIIDDSEELKNLQPSLTTKFTRKERRPISRSLEQMVILKSIKLLNFFKNFNREDLEVLWAIVKDRFKKEKIVDDMDNLLFRTLKTMFEHHVEDNIWKYQQGLAKDKDCQGRLLVGFQDDIKYEHVGPKTQGRKKVKYYKDDQVTMKDLKGKVNRQRQRKDQDQDHKCMIGTKRASTSITRERLKIKTRSIKDQRSRTQIEISMITP
nr:hypothetical protein [Tanacetum cinerariifolium]